MHKSKCFHGPVRVASWQKILRNVSGASLAMLFLIQGLRAGTPLLESPMANLDGWSSVSGSAPTRATSGLSPDGYMQLGNGVARANLSAGVSGNWTLSFKALHSSYQRGLAVGVLNAAGTQGYGVLWDSSSAGSWNGEGYVSLRKFNLASEPAFGVSGTAISPNTASGHAATAGPFAQIDLSWDAASHTLYLRVDGIPKAQILDASFQSFARVYLIGNTYSYIDDVIFFAEEPPTAGAIAAAINLRSLGATGNGVTDDQAAINQAVQLAVSLGKAVYVPPGVYKYSSKIELPGVSVFGHGYASVLAAANPNNSSVVLKGNGASIKTCRITSSGATTRATVPASALINAYGASNFEVSGCYLDRAASNGVIACSLPSSHGNISNNWIANTLADGIHLTCGANNIVVSGNYLRNTEDDFIGVVAYAGQTTCSAITIANNDARWQRVTGRGITCVGGENVTIKNNTIESSQGAGVYVASEGVQYQTYGCKNIQVTGNTIIGACRAANSPHGAIHLRGRAGYPVENILVDGNTVTNAACWGVRILDEVQGATFSNNQVVNSGKEGVDCQGTCTDVTISGNTFTNIGGYGIYSSKSGTPGFLKIQQNQFTNIHTIGTETYTDVILLVPSAWNAVTITGNSYTNPGNYVIERYIECHDLNATVNNNWTNTGKPSYVGK